MYLKENKTGSLKKFISYNKELLCVIKNFEYIQNDIEWIKNEVNKVAAKINFIKPLLL
jgi:hypothetical protein